MINVRCFSDQLPQSNTDQRTVVQSCSDEFLTVRSKRHRANSSQPAGVALYLHISLLYKAEYTKLASRILHHLKWFDSHSNQTKILSPLWKYHVYRVARLCLQKPARTDLVRDALMQDLEDDPQPPALD